MLNILITGITGQDGTLLSEKIQQQIPDCAIFGTSRNADIKNLDLKIYTNDLLNQNSVLDLIEEVNPDIIFHFAGQSSVSQSFKDPIGTQISNTRTTLNLLNSIKAFNKKISFFYSCSSDCFGCSKTPFSERSPFNPMSPYASSKVQGYEIIKSFRESGLKRLTVGFLTNHESIIRPSQYVTKKIALKAREIKDGNDNCIVLGNIDIYRDWGYANEYVDAILELMLKERYSDYVIGTGSSHTLREFAEKIFSYHDLDLNSYLKINKSYFRDAEINYSFSNPAKIKNDIGWFAKTNLSQLSKIIASSTY